MSQHNGMENSHEVGGDMFEFPHGDEIISMAAFNPLKQDDLCLYSSRHTTGMRDLATEVLIHVFRHTVPTSRRHIRLTHVCHLWRMIILDIPEFWADMLSVTDFWAVQQHDRSVKLWHTFMDRVTATPSMPLKLYLQGSTLYLLKSILPYLPRVAHLQVQCRPDDLACVLALGPLEALQTFICTSGTASSKSVCNPYDGSPLLSKYPLLQHLEFDPKCFSATRRMTAPCLRTLIVHPGALSALDFLTSLSLYPALEVLHMRGVTTHGRGSVTGCAQLPSLREWSMTSGQDWVQSMLNHIYCPPTTSITIWSSYTYLSIHFRSVLPLFIEDRRGRCLYTLHYLKELHMPALSVEAYVTKEKSPRFRMTTTDVTWRVGSGQLINAKSTSIAFSVVQTFLKFPVEGITTLELWLSSQGEGMTHARWKILLQAFSSLRSLTVRVPSCRSLLKALRRYIIPRSLEKLDITSDNGTGAYRSLVRTVEECVDEGMHLQHIGFYHRKHNSRFPHELLGRICTIVPEVVIGTF